MNTQTIDPADYELRFQSLHHAGRAMAFPCDASGHVDMDALGRAALNNYLYARAFIGREFDTPCIRIVDRAPAYGLRLAAGPHEAP